MLSKLGSIPARFRGFSREGLSHTPEQSSLVSNSATTAGHTTDRPGLANGAAAKWIGGYLLAIGAVALACVITIPLRQFASGMPNQFFFFAAVVFSAWYCGAGPGLLSAILSTVAIDYFLLNPVYDISFGPQDIFWSLSFLACFLFTYKVSLQRRQVEEALKKAGLELEERVRERSLELESANRWAISQIVERSRAEVALREAQSDLLRFSRIVTIGETTAAIAHEINQPLAAIAANANAAKNWLGRSPPNVTEAQTSVTEIAQAAERAGEVIGRVRSLMKRSRPQFEQIDANEIVDNVLALSDAMLAERGIAVRKVFTATDRFVRGDRIQLQQVVLNLVNNAAEAMAGIKDRDRRLKIKTGNERDQRVLISVLDRGDGIDPDLLDRLFMPFYTTRQDGMGMGLAICKTIVQSHGGEIFAVPRRPYGTEFRVMLPIARAQ